MNIVEQHEVASSSAEDLPPQTPQECNQTVSQQNTFMLTEDTLKAIDAELGKLPPRHAITVEAAIKKLAPRIKKMRADGYSAAEVAAELNQRLGVFNMSISARSLARYLPPKTKPSAKQRAV